jgi:hypothetical protein
MYYAKRGVDGENRCILSWKSLCSWGFRKRNTSSEAEFEYRKTAASRTNRAFLEVTDPKRRMG